MEEIGGWVSHGDLFCRGEARNLEWTLFQGMTHGNTFTDQSLPLFSPTALKYEGLIITVQP